jgi:non-ribosomal peptide synthetase component E (peptide arylation enzyme)
MEMQHILPFVEAKAIIIPWKFRDFDYVQMVNQLKPVAPMLKHIIVAGDDVPQGTISLKEIMVKPLEKKYPPEFLEKRKCAATEFSMVVHTTGTTGFPKFVEHGIAGRLCTARGHIAGTRLNFSDVVAALGPAAAGPNAIVYLSAPYVGAKIVMLEHFEAEVALALIEKEKVTAACLVPAMLAMMIKSPNFHEYDLSSLRAIISTGAVLSYELALEAEEKVHRPVVQFYGSMDGGGLSITPIDAPREQRLLTVGKPYTGNEVKFIDDNGEEVQRGEIGEIVARGPTMDCAFFKDPKATMEAWSPDGWFHMGDLGKWDEHGNIMIVGRKKDIIIRGGQNIYPAEVESLILQHPKVLSVAIVPMPDTVMGERACAFVVPKPGQSVTLEELSAFLKSKSIAPFKIPERLEIAEKMPMAGDIKIDRKVLTQEILAKLQSEGKVK